MADEKIYPPPKPTTPEKAPWTDVQSIINRLDLLIASNNAYSAAVVQLIAAMGGQNITVNVPTTTPTYTAPAPAQTNVTDFVDAGVATGGTITTLQDSKKSWQAGTLQGALLFVTIGAQLYQTTITANRNNELTFVTLNVSVTAGAQYFIKRPVFGNKGSFVTGQAIIAAAGTPVNLPDIPIPWGSAAILMANPDNGGNIFIGNSQPNVLKTTPDPTTGTMRFEYLAAGDSIPIHQSNLNQYWVDTDNNGDSVVWII